MQGRSGNIFQNLTDELHNIESRANGDEELAKLIVAGTFLEICFGTEWFNRKIELRDEPDEWMHNLKGDTGIGQVVYAHRVIRLADAIFTLLNAGAKGWDLLKQRLSKRSMKSSFVEAEIASLLAYNGYDLEIVKESGIRGDDFDFTATRNGVTLSVEVTAKDDASIAVNTIRNTLNSKRTQVPQHRPAVLYMRIPPEWMEDDPGKAYEIFSEAFNTFCKKSRRFNAMVLVWEKVVPFADGGIARGYFRACYNNLPRHPHPDLTAVAPIEGLVGGDKVAHSLFEFLKSKQNTG
jgi:hypothetical protein